MTRTTSSFRRPDAEQQQLLDHATVRLVHGEEQERFDALLCEHHYLRSASAVGEHLRYVAVLGEQWLGLALWAAPALHLRAREEFIGWSDEQRRRRLALLANNTRLLIVPEVQCPNLISRFMKLMLARLAGDWQARWGHPIALVESFVDPQFFQGTAYKVSGWQKLGASAGFARTGAGQDYYVAHGQPKTLWVRELVAGAAKKLREPVLREPWAAVEDKSAPRCRASAPQIGSLLERLGVLPEFRAKSALAYPLPGMLSLIAMALFCGVMRGQRDLAAFARTLSQSQLRALRFRCNRHTGKVRCPDETTFFRVLGGVDERLLEAALLAWQEQMLGPAQDEIIAIDGKKLRHARGVELVSAIGVKSGRWMGTVCTEAKSNEPSEIACTKCSPQGSAGGRWQIPAARELLGRLEVAGKTVIADALHTQVETAQQILFEKGADYILTVKDNQKGLHTTVASLLTEQAPHCAHRGHPSLPQ